MSVRDYFTSVDTITPAEARDFMNTHDPADYNLIDVRQPREYEQGHLPGARLIPVAELAARRSELDPLKPTITY